MEEIGKIDADENALIEARTANTSSMRQSQQVGLSWKFQENYGINVH